MKTRETYQEVYKAVFGRNRTIKEALLHLRKTRTGDTRIAHTHQGFSERRNPIVEDQLERLLSDAVLLGFGSDKNFDRVYR